MPQVIQESVNQSTPNAVVTKSTTEATATQTSMYLVYFVAGVLEIMLLFRLFFRLTGANPGSGFVSFIYSLTWLLVLPFKGIFPVATTEGAVATAVFEPSTIVAMIVYAAIAWGIVQLMAILSRQAE